MPIRIMVAHYRGFMLIFAIIMANWLGVAHAQSTPDSSSLDALQLRCEANSSLCEGDGVLVEFPASGLSTRTGTAWVLARVTLQPGATVQPQGGDPATRYTIHVQEGTVGLTASTPITCVGACDSVALDDEALANATPVAGSIEGFLIPAETEVILSPGDVATFESADDSIHIYRNAGETDARFVTSLHGPAPSLGGRCMGRCLGDF